MIACADLIVDLLVAANYGKVYITSDTGTTTSNFVDGAGVSIAAGDNVEITNVGTAENPVYKFKLNKASGGGQSGHDFNQDDFDVVANEVSLTPEQRVFTGTTQEWNDLSSAEKALYGIVNLTDDEVVAQADVYSASEVKTNKVWFDGKPIYRKCYNINSATFSVSVAGCNIDTLVTLFGLVYDSQYNCQYHTSLADANNYSMGYIYYPGSNTIERKKSTAWGNRLTHKYMCIEYTKTTD